MSGLKEKYPRELFQIQGIANDNLDINAFSKHFFGKSASVKNVASISSDPNANVNEMNICQWTHEAPKGILKVNSLYLMWDYIKKSFSKEDADEIIEAIVNGSIFVNDAHQFERPYCFGFDLSIMCSEGLNFFNGLMKIKAPKRADSFIDLTIQGTALLSNSLSGATSFPTFFVNFDYFLRKDFGESYSEGLTLSEEDKSGLSHRISNLFQKIIYSWNFPFRGSQSPFCNLSILDRGFLEALFGLNEYGAPKYTNPDGSAPDLDSIYRLQKFFYVYFDSIFGVEGIFTFPVVTLALSTKEESVVNEDGSVEIKKVYSDLDFVDWISEVYGDKCVANIYVGSPNSFSSCCRMKNDFEKLDKTQKQYQNSFGVSGISIGSTRVSGLNLPRIAFEMKRDNTLDYKPYVDKYLSMCHKVLYAHRALLKNHIKAGALPLYDHGWLNLDHQYITYGFIGAYEFLDILGKDIIESEGSDYLVNLLVDVELQADKWSIEDKIASNVEQIPGESMSVRLADIDKLLGYNKDYKVDLYSNQYVPLVNEVSMYDRFRLQGKFDSLTSGGSILHLNIHDGATLTPKTVKKLINTAKDTGTVYWAVNRVFSLCENNHHAISNNGSCPVCKGNIVRSFTRVVGFIVSVDSWSPVRQEKDYPNRIFYQETENCLTA
jgi:ribonucleoside-triphosphate reductase